jgi:lipopolysaccharide transport system ATP-binding protein
MNHYGKPLHGDVSVGGVFNLGDSAKKGMKQVRLYCNDMLTDIIHVGGRFRFEIDFEDDRPIREVVLGFVIKNTFGKEVIGVNNRHRGVRLFPEPVKQGTVTTDFDYLPLYGDGRYSVDLYFGDSEVNYDVVKDAFSFILKPCDAYGSGRELDKSLNDIFFREIRMYGERVLAV